MWPLSQFMQQVLDLMQESAVTVPLPSALPHWPTMSLALHSPLKNHTDSLSRVLPDLIHTHSFKQIHGTQDIIPKELLKDTPFVHKKRKLLTFMKAFDIFQNVLIQNTTKILSKKKTSCSQILDWQDLCVHPLCDCERIQSTVAASNPFYALSLVFIPNPVPPVSVLLTQAHLSLEDSPAVFRFIFVMKHSRRWWLNICSFQELLVSGITRFRHYSFQELLVSGIPNFLILS